jgi:hypothetical protein
VGLKIQKFILQKLFLGGAAAYNSFGPYTYTYTTGKISEYTGLSSFNFGGSIGFAFTKKQAVTAGISKRSGSGSEVYNNSFNLEYEDSSTSLFLGYSISF